MDCKCKYKKPTDEELDRLMERFKETVRKHPETLKTMERIMSGLFLEKEEKNGL